jgi:hypothetical protein
VSCGLQHATCSNSRHHDSTSGHGDDSASESSLSAEEVEAIQEVHRSPLVAGRADLLREAEQHALEYPVDSDEDSVMKRQQAAEAYLKETQSHLVMTQSQL